MIGGVCGGLGRRYGIDPLVLRVVFVVGVLASGVGLLVYLALWLLIPDDRDTAPGPLTHSFFPLVIGTLLGLGALAALIGWFGSLGGLAGVVVGAFLVGLAVWLYQRRDTFSPAPAVGPQPDAAWSVTGEQSTAQGWNPPTGFAYGGTGYTPGTGPVPPPTPSRPRSYLGLITLCAALAVGAGLAAAAAAGISPIGIVGGMAAMLAVLAIGLLIGAFRGRARWLVIVALPLALMLGVVGQVSSVLQSPISGNVGTPTWEPMSSAEYSLGVGEAVLDLRPWAASTTTEPRPNSTVRADVNLGQLQVIVPETWRVAVEATTQAGEITVNSEPIRSDSPSAEFTGVLAPVGDAAGSVTLKLNVDVGEIDIRQRPVIEAVDSPTTGPTEPTQQKPGKNDSKNNTGQNATKENSR